MAVPVTLLSIDGGPQTGITQALTLMALESEAFDIAQNSFCLPDDDSAYYDVEEKRFHLSELYDYIIGT